MKKSKIMPYLTYFTIIFILLSVLPGDALAAKGSSNQEHGSQDQFISKGTTGSEYNETDNAGDANNSEPSQEQSQNDFSVKNQDRVSEYKQERKQLKEELQFRKQEYQEAKVDFIKIRNRIREGELKPNSEETLNATRLYLNSSIEYMIAHLSNVKGNMKYSSGNGTEERIIAIDENIKLLEAEKAKVANASSAEDLVVVVRSVRGVWSNAQKISLSGAGQTVSEKIGEFLEKSESLSQKLETEIENLNKTGIDTIGLETKLSNYNLYIESVQEKKEKADFIYSDENVTQENMEIANNYLRQSIDDINKANDILRQIFGELKEKEYEIKKMNETEVENSLKAELNDTKSINI